MVDESYLVWHFSLLTAEGKRKRAEYRSQVMYAFSAYVSGWYPCKVLSFADIARVQLKVSYVRGIWLELHYHNGERKKWFIEAYLDSAAAETAQHIIVAYTRYVTEHPQLIEQT